MIKAKPNAQRARATHLIIKIVVIAALVSYSSFCMFMYVWFFLLFFVFIYYFGADCCFNFITSWTKMIRSIVENIANELNDEGIF